MKKIVFLILCAMLATMAAGCSNSDKTAESSTSAASQTSSTKNETNSKTLESSKEESSKAEVSNARDYTKEKAEGEITDDGLLIVKQDDHWRAMEQFGGGSGDSYVESLNKLREKLDSKVKIYSMPAPLACEFYTPSNLSDKIGRAHV